MGRHKTQEIAPYALAFEPLILKQLIIDCGISQTRLGAISDLSRASINLTVNRGYIPIERENFKELIEKEISSNVTAAHWLVEHKMKVEDIWLPLGRDLRKACPEGRGARVWETRKKPVFTKGNTNQTKSKEDVEMIKPEAMKHFHIFRNPFFDDIQKGSDIFMSEEHRYIEAAMIDAAQHSGFLAVIGEVGSGKTVIRRKIMEQLKKDNNTVVIFPRIVDKTRVNFSSICDAIIMDLSEESPKRTLEAKSRQVERLLQERSKQNLRIVLILEEAHDLTVSTLKYLKRFQEMEDGYQKLLGIIMIGQTELNNLLDVSRHIEMREVILRIQTCEIKGLNGNTKEYLRKKFNRVNVKVEDIFDDSAFKALSNRLTVKDRYGKSMSHAYPLTVNNYAARAMNMAFEMGFKKVNEEVIMAM